MEVISNERLNVYKLRLKTVEIRVHSVIIYFCMARGGAVRLKTKIRSKSGFWLSLKKFKTQTPGI